MDKDKIAEIRQRLDKFNEGFDFSNNVPSTEVLMCLTAYRQDISTLLAEIERLEAALAEAEERIEYAEIRAAATYTHTGKLQERVQELEALLAETKRLADSYYLNNHDYKNDIARLNSELSDAEETLVKREGELHKEVCRADLAAEEVERLKAENEKVKLMNQELVISFTRVKADNDRLTEALKFVEPGKRKKQMKAEIAELKAECERYKNEFEKECEHSAEIKRLRFEEYEDRKRLEKIIAQCPVGMNMAACAACDIRLGEADAADAMTKQMIADITAELEAELNVVKAVRNALIEAIRSNGVSWNDETRKDDKCEICKNTNFKNCTKCTEGANSEAVKSGKCFEFNYERFKEGGKL